MSGIDCYTAVQHRTMRDYRTKMPEMDRSEMHRSPLLVDDYHLRLKNLADGGKSQIDKALRFLSGQETMGRICAEGALQAMYTFRDMLMDPLSDVSQPGPARSRGWILCGVWAHSIIAYAYYTKYMATPIELVAIRRDAEELPTEQARADARKVPRLDKQRDPCDPIDNILRAVKHANAAAKFHFYSQAVLMVGFAFKGLMESLPGMHVWLFKEYAPLWRALEMQERMLPLGWRDIPKVVPPPGCLIVGCEGKVTDSCRGNCPWHLRPKFCKKHWTVENYGPAWHPQALCAGLCPLAPPPSVNTDDFNTLTTVYARRTTGPVIQAEVEVDYRGGRGWNQQHGRIAGEILTPAVEVVSRWIPQTGASIRYFWKTYD